MENLIFNSEKKINTTNFVRIGDLSYFEGPLLSLFQESKSGHFYIFDWVDRDNKFNRWIIYRIKPEYISKYLSGKLSHLDLYKNRQDKVYFTDIDSHHKSYYHYDAYQVKKLPKSYIPNSNNFFELLDSNAFEKIKSVIEDSFSRQKLENEYSKMFKVNILKPEEIKSNYYNKIPSVLRNIQFIYKHNKIFYPESENLFISNEFNCEKFMSYSFLEKSELIKRNEYANQYN